MQPTAASAGGNFHVADWVPLAVRIDHHFLLLRHVALRHAHVKPPCNANVLVVPFTYSQNG